jgi:alanyl-tRNA synthetase
MKTAREIRKRYIDYFKSLDHIEIKSASLVPENDSTTLFTGSGMQPLIPYLLGESHPDGSRLVNSQKCFRAEDIDEVGDNRHTTFFEMLGNWSLGDYFKEQQLPWLFNFLTDKLGLDPSKLYATVFAGDKNTGIQKDQKSIDIWAGLFEGQNVDSKVVNLSLPDQGGKKGMQEGRIFIYGANENWWSRAGGPDKMPAGEPGGPDSEVFYDFGIKHNKKFGDNCHPNCGCGRFLEIGNSVFMEYIKKEDGGFGLLPKKNVDFGGGLERLTAAGNDDSDIFMVNVLKQCIDGLEQITKKKYSDELNKESFRIVADHIRGAVFMISDGVEPTNTDRGYFVRRLLRRAIRHLDILGAQEGAASSLAKKIIDEYGDEYGHLAEQQGKMKEVFEKEEAKFRSTLRSGLKEFERKIKKKLTGQDAWYLFTTYGFPVEMTKDLAKEHGVSVEREFDLSFERAKREHKDISKKGSEKKFRGGLADHSDKSIKYHTATHLLHAALRKILGEHVVQTGSNITTERLRFDFRHDKKLTSEEIKAVEKEVNMAIESNLDVKKEEMSVNEAKQRGAIGLFEEKYGSKVNVYEIVGVSIEICGGPHIENTGQLGRFQIIKEESASAGIRRIKGVLG